MTGGEMDYFEIPLTDEQLFGRDEKRDVSNKNRPVQRAITVLHAEGFIWSKSKKRPDASGKHEIVASGNFNKALNGTVNFEVTGPPWVLRIEASKPIPEYLKLALADAINGTKPLVARNPAVRSFFKTEEAALAARTKTLSLVKGIAVLVFGAIKSGRMPTGVIVEAKKWQAAREYGEQVEPIFVNVFCLDQDIGFLADENIPLGENLFGEATLSIDLPALLRANPDFPSLCQEAAPDMVITPSVIIDKLSATPIRELDVTLGKKTSVETRPMTGHEKEDFEDILRGDPKRSKPRNYFGPKFG